MNIVSIAGAIVIIAVVVLVLRQYKPEYAIAVVIISSVVILMLLIRQTLPIFDVVRDLMNKANFSLEHIEILIKCLGICYVTKFAGDICLDCGQSSLASKVDLAGKIAILVVSIPLFVTLIDIASSAMSI